MELYWYVMIFIFGAVIGSFLNVVLYRLHTGKSLKGHSHCLSCGEQLRWYELFPVFSYFMLRAQCRHCSSHIPARYVLVELLTGFLFVLLYSLFSDQMILLVLHLILGSILILIAVYDIRHTIIPDELTLLTGAIALGFIIHSLTTGSGITLIGIDILGGLGAAVFIGGLWYISKGRWIGLGDAKLVLPLGIIVGFPAAFSLVVFSFWIGALVSITLLFLQWCIRKGKTALPFLSERITIKSEVPFAPFLILGFFITELFHADVLDLTFRLITLLWE